MLIKNLFRSKIDTMRFVIKKVSNPYSEIKRGFRKDIGISVRSRWEANTARYLNFLKRQKQIKDWKYECKTFEFPIKRGTRFYTPDFKITENNGEIKYWEIKGYMDKISKTKLKRMKKYYPDVKLRVIEGKEYKGLAKQLKGFIPNWE